MFSDRLGLAIDPSLERCAVKSNPDVNNIWAYVQWKRFREILRVIFKNKTYLVRRFWFPSWAFYCFGGFRFHWEIINIWVWAEIWILQDLTISVSIGWRHLSLIYFVLFQHVGVFPKHNFISYNSVPWHRSFAACHCILLGYTVYALLEPMEASVDTNN